MTTTTSRFAPSTTGSAHPGTLLAALLCWLDARQLGAHLLLRLENLDPHRCKPELISRLQDELAWFGLDWDEVRVQSDNREVHEQALDALDAAGVLYPCLCSRAVVRSAGRRAPDGGWAYINTCRSRSLPLGGWRKTDEPLRVRLPDTPVVLRDESGLDLSQDAGRAMGDPVVRRRDGSIAYNLAAIVDDNSTQVTRIVRGRDIAPSSATQEMLRGLLEYPPVAYRHHLLLLERHREKLSKIHGSVAVPELSSHYGPEELCGVIAQATGIRGTAAPTTPNALLEEFSWQRVHTQDQELVWEDHRLRTQPAVSAAGLTNNTDH